MHVRCFLPRTCLRRSFNQQTVDRSLSFNSTLRFESSHISIKIHVCFSTFWWRPIEGHRFIEHFIKRKLLAAVTALQCMPVAGQSHLAMTCVRLNCSRGRLQQNGIPLSCAPGVFPGSRVHLRVNILWTGDSHIGGLALSIVLIDIYFWMRKWTL